MIFGLVIVGLVIVGLVIVGLVIVGLVIVGLVIVGLVIVGQVIVGLVVVGLVTQTHSIQPFNQNILPIFTDEKTFTVEEHFNVQNDRIYAKSHVKMSEPAKRVLRSHHPASVMV